MGTNMNTLLRQMGASNPDGTRRVALWALSSTGLPKRDIPRALADFASVGYLCEETHGVRGDRRSEIAGVMVCIDPRQLRFLNVGQRKQRHRVVRTGRILRVRLGIMGATADDDFDVMACYMPTRGAQRRGGQESSEASRQYTLAVWRSLATTTLPLAGQGRALVMGDLNAELGHSLRHRGRRASPSDTALAHLVDMGRVSRVHHESDWTYWRAGAGDPSTSVIDHILASDIMRPNIADPRTVDGIESGRNRHRALEAKVIWGSTGNEDDEGERLVDRVKVCHLEGPREHEAYEECKLRYKNKAPGAVEEAVARAGGWDAEPRTLLMAIQDGTAQAMRDTLARENEGKAAKPRRKGGTSAKRAQAVFWEAALRERRGEIGGTPDRAPKTLDRWRDLFIDEPRARKAYSTFHRESEMWQRIKEIYSSELKRRTLGGYGGECATQEDAASTPNERGSAIVTHRHDDAPPAPTGQLYSILGVAADATTDTVRRAYRREALLWHPDRNRNAPADVQSRAEARFKLINEAHEVLTDTNRRRAYDSRARGRKAQMSPYCYEGRTQRLLSKAGLDLAQRRRELELATINLMLPSIQEVANDEREYDRASYYEHRMEEAARRGAVESVVFSLVYAHERSLGGRNAPLTRAQGGKLSAVGQPVESASQK